MAYIAIVEPGDALFRCLSGLPQPVRALGPSGGQGALVVVGPDCRRLPPGPLRCRILLLAWAGTCLLAGADPEALGKNPCPFPGKRL